MILRTEVEAIRAQHDLTNGPRLSPERVHIFQGGPLCQWAHAPFLVSGYKFATAEHFMMAMKARLFSDHDVFVQILNSTSPKEAKTLGRRVRHFDEETWTRHRYDIVWMGNFLKFSQVPGARQALIDTLEKIIIEANPNDEVWAVGRSPHDANILTPLNWRGTNLLGFILMSVRDAVRLLP